MGHLECIDLLKLFLSNPDRLDPLLFQNGFSQRMKRGEHAGDEAQQESYKQPNLPAVPPREAKFFFWEKAVR